VKAGDVVVTRPGATPLRSGSQSYDSAVVVRVSPLALCSRGRDMVWYQYYDGAAGLFVIADVTPDELALCAKRALVDLGGGS
jgi:hypothetical protein